MKLYGLAGSGNVRTVLAVANRLGISLDVEFLDVFAGELATPEFMALNPNKKVPVLVDGDFVLWESIAIAKYLCAQVEGQTLYPQGMRAQAEVDQWLCWELAHYNQAFGSLAWESVALPKFFGKEGNQAVSDDCVEKLKRYAGVLEAHLEGRNYMVGDDITLADYAIIHIEFMKEAVPFDWSPYPNVNAYYERMRVTPHWKSTAVAPEEMGRRQPA